MAVPSGEYFDGEQGSGDNTGCLITICVMAFIVFGSMVVQKTKNNPNSYKKQKIETINDVNKYYIDSGTIKIDSIKTR